jgi:GTP-binding protein
MMSTTFAGYKPYAGAFAGRDRGNLLSSSTGTVTGHALKSVQERGQLFAVQGDEVYENQIIGISAKADDLKVNPCKAKQLTNMRAASKEETVHLNAPMMLTLEDAVEYVVEGEFVEVTPSHVRMGMYEYDPKKSRQKK